MGKITDLNYDKIPDAIIEHMLASEYGWDLDYIRNLGNKKAREHIYICLIKQNIVAKKSIG